MASAQVQPGDVLAGKYRVERVLGQGNMGVVVAASHLELAQRVALKFMLAGAAGQKDHRERFLREARASVRLKSQHVARVLDVGTLDGDTPYIVMELLEGADLAAMLVRGGPLPFASAVEYVLQACEAVAEAHSAGIVHRDLKPANLFLTHDVGGAPCIKVLDFGISKASGVDLTLTQDAQALGSPLYMSPEQMNSAKDVDARSDIWALGIVLYQLVTGVTPFHAESIQALCARVLFGQPTPLAELRPDAPAGFEAVVRRCLERNREQRFHSVAELAAALAPFAPPSAIGYVQRVSRVLGVAVPAGLHAAAPVAGPVVAPAPAASGGPAMAVASPQTSTIVMPSPVGRASSPGFTSSPDFTSSPGFTSPPNRASSPGFASSPNLTSSPNLAGSPNLGGSSPGLASSQGSLVSPGAPAQRTGPLVLAAAGGAMLVTAVVAGVLWLRPPSPGVQPPPVPETPPSAAPSPAQRPPEVAPAATVVPAASSAPATRPEPSATAHPAPTASSTTPRSTAAMKPPGKPPSKSGVSYDDRQ